MEHTEKMVTSRQIMDATGITNVATLIRWHNQEGLIPHPEIRTHPNGRGKMAYWPKWVLDRCVRITQLRREGKQLHEIRNLLGSDWSQEASHYRRRYKFAEASARIDQNAALMNLRWAVEDYLTDWIHAQEQLMQQTIVQLLAMDTIEKALAIMAQGVNPVLILTKDCSYLTADFAVSHHLSRCSRIDDAFMVIPIFREVSAYLRSVMSLPKKPTVVPVTRVVRGGDDDPEELDIVTLQNWSFEIQHPR